jgi:hypothetical protein
MEFCLVQKMDVFSFCSAALNLLILPYLAVGDDGDCGAKR